MSVENYNALHTYILAELNKSFVGLLSVESQQVTLAKGQHGVQVRLVFHSQFQGPTKHILLGKYQPYWFPFIEKYKLHSTSLRDPRERKSNMIMQDIFTSDKKCLKFH